MNSSLQENHIDEIVRLSYEGSTLDDLGTQVLPMLNRALDASASLLYRCTEESGVVALSGSLAEIHDNYMQNYFSEDIVQGALRRLNPWVMHLSSLPEWKPFQGMGFFNELLHPREADHFYFLRLAASDHKQAGDVGIMVARSAKLPDFSTQESLTVMRVFPALEALVRRSVRGEHRLRQSLVETICEMDPQPKIAMGLRGELLWMTDSGALLLGMHDRRKTELPDALVQAALQMSKLLDKKSPRLPPPFISVPRKNGPPIRADLRLFKIRGGESFILAELSEREVHPDLTKLASRYGLTASETQALNLLAQGLSDQEMANALFVSVATVRTHVGHIFEKLNVRSRMQAALVAHGHSLRPVKNLSEENL